MRGQKERQGRRENRQSIPLWALGHTPEAVLGNGAEYASEQAYQKKTQIGGTRVIS